MDKKISIIVPVYNAEKTLDRCVQSLQSQTYSHIEIILVNDGSKDNSLEICRRYAREDSRIRVIDKPNGGVSSARNAGLDAATGDFVMFCDSDDWADPDWCRCMQAHFRPGTLAICEFHWEEIVQSDPLVPEEEVDRKRYMHNTALMCAPYNKIFDRTVLETHKIRFSRELSLGEDLVFCLNYLCALEGGIRYLYRKLYFYDTSNEGSLSNRAPALEQCQLFYQSVKDAMERLGATDDQSLFIRDTFVATHFERYLKGIARNTELSVLQKMRIAAQVGRMEGYRNTCAQGIRWGNPIYLWLMQHQFVRMGMAYMLLVLKIKKRI